MTRNPHVLPVVSAPEEEPFERSLRPQTLDEFVGQDRLKRICAFSSKPRASAKSRWITACFIRLGPGQDTLAGLSP